MGWAIQRPDGTFRCWNANSQDDTLRNGEVWVALDSPPVITTPPLPATSLAVALDNAIGALPSIDVRIKAVFVEWRKRVA